MPLVTADALRTRFSTALSEMYRTEVPLYGDLVRLVAGVNAASGHPERNAARIAVERHGAIRLGRPEELRLIGRLFAVMGMEPVGYYDLAAAGVPVHSTAFRPITEASLARNPFRMFTSLLRTELIEDDALRREAERILAERRIMSPRLTALVAIAEIRGGLAEIEAQELVRECLATFRWNPDAAVDRSTYDRLRAAHPLIADVVCFKGPHVNHLTPRTFDIDAVHAAMRRAGMEPKACIEGPPRRRVPILLRQTSFKAREERTLFAGDSFTHTARFGEVEQRGAALTQKGRALYDRLLRSGDPDAFDAFPDDLATLRREALIFCRHRRPDAHAHAGDAAEFEPITYEDFLPVSAAGIFRSNLPGSVAIVDARPGDQRALEAALGRTLLSETSLYDEIERASLVSVSGGSSIPGRAETSR